MVTAQIDREDSAPNFFKSGFTFEVPIPSNSILKINNNVNSLKHTTTLYGVMLCYNNKENVYLCVIRRTKWINTATAYDNNNFYSNKLIRFRTLPTITLSS